MSRGRDYDTGIAVRLRDVRGDRRQEDIAAAMREAGWEFKQTAVSDYERGTTVPPQYIIGFCETFDIHPVWLLTGEGERQWNLTSERERRREIIAGWLQTMAKRVTEGLEDAPTDPTLEMSPAPEEPQGRKIAAEGS